MNNLIVKSTPKTPDLSAGKVSHGPAWLGLIGAAMCVFWLLVAIFGPWLAPHPVGEVVSDNVFDSISALYPFGTDYLGRDMLSRVLVGARLPWAWRWWRRYWPVAWAPVARCCRWFRRSGWTK